MKSQRRRLAAVAAVLVCTPLTLSFASLPAPAAAGGRTASPRYYLALGDSAPIWNGTRSYPDLILKRELSSVPNLVLVNDACSGETSSSFISGSLCAPGGSQLNEATTFLREHRHHLALVTIDIGGNDIVGCATAVSTATCVAQALKTIKTNVTKIMKALRTAAGATTRIVGMNYYDPFLGDWLAGGSTKALAIASVAALKELNSELAGIYEKAGAPTADVQHSFRSTDLTQMVASKWGSVPVAVARACGWLDIVCHRHASEGLGDDPNDSGAIAISWAFMKVIGKIP
ncbi:MAG: SGNH/GDSL hydrolase family protein [Acidimicrobiales bacterium]